jgi:hypothetical protein
MTTVRTLHRFACLRLLASRGVRVEGKLRWAVLVCLAFASPASGQDSTVHWSHAGSMPPGAIGRQRLMRGGPLSGYCQPVEIRAPKGARISPAAGTGYTETEQSNLLVGLAIGPVYRFRITDVPEHPGLEIFPTVEMIDRLYPPPGQALRFPVPVELTLNELLMAADGRFVTRIIYVEDPQLAVPVSEKSDSETRWFDVPPGEDPLVTADSLGRPIAILRMGGRLPEAEQTEASFAYGAPEPLIYQRQDPSVSPSRPLPMLKREELTPPPNP